MVARSKSHYRVVAGANGRASVKVVKIEADGGVVPEATGLDNQQAMQALQLDRSVRQDETDHAK